MIKRNHKPSPTATGDERQPTTTSIYFLKDGERGSKHHAGDSATNGRSSPLLVGCAVWRDSLTEKERRPRPAGGWGGGQAQAWAFPAGEAAPPTKMAIGYYLPIQVTHLTNRSVHSEVRPCPARRKEETEFGDAATQEYSSKVPSVVAVCWLKTRAQLFQENPPDFESSFDSIRPGRMQGPTSCNGSLKALHILPRCKCNTCFVDVWEGTAFIFNSKCLHPKIRSFQCQEPH